MHRRRKAKLEVSLFPFLSVLVCIIGTLSLLIVATAMGSSDEDPTEPIPEPIPESTRGDVEIAHMEGDKEIAQAQIDVHEGLLKELLKKLREITTLQNQTRNVREKAKAYGKKKASLEDELKNLMRRNVEEARKLKELRQRANEAANPAVEIEPPKGRHKYYPIYVDCRKDGILVLSSQKHISTKDVSGSKYVNNLLSKTKTAGNWCIFMLVRRDGVKAFNKIYYKILGAGVPYGFHPIIVNGPLKASNCKKPEWLK